MFRGNSAAAIASVPDRQVQAGRETVVRASLKVTLLSGIVFTVSAGIATRGVPNGVATLLAIGSSVTFIVGLLWMAVDD